MAGALALIIGMKLLESLDHYLDERRSNLRQQNEYQHTSTALPSYERITTLSPQFPRDDSKERYVSFTYNSAPHKHS